MDNDNIRFIELTNSTCFASVDTEDYERVKALDTNWYLMETSRDSKSIISTKHFKYGQIQLSRFALNAHNTSKFIVDHKNRDIFNNRKENLRFATPSESLANTKISVANTTGVKNVTFRKRTNNWTVSINKEGKLYYRGGFETKEKAIEYRNKLAKQLYGEFATF